MVPFSDAGEKERKVRLCLVDLFSISDGYFMQQSLRGHRYIRPYRILKQVFRLLV